MASRHDRLSRSATARAALEGSRDGTRGVRVRVPLVALMVVGLLLALAAVARADEPAAVIVPAGATRVEPSTEVRFLVTRASLDRALVEYELSQQRRKAWGECEQRAARLTASEPRWLTAVKFTAIGLFIGGAFAAGVMAAQ
jgi:hypothetical protein